MKVTQTEKIAYIVTCNLPIRSIVSCEGELRLRFTMALPFAKEEYHLEHKNVGKDIQPFIDDFFKKAVDAGLAYTIQDLMHNLEFDEESKVTTIVIKVLLIGKNAQEFIKQTQN